MHFPRQKTFQFLFCFLLRSVDNVGRPFCFGLFLIFSIISFFLSLFLSFLFFSTADFLQCFLLHFSTDLNKIWPMDSP